MTDIRLPEEELRQLISGLFDDDLSVQERHRLAELLAADPVARAFYYSQSRMHASLIWNNQPCSAGPLAESDVPMPFGADWLSCDHVNASGVAVFSPSHGISKTSLPGLWSGFFESMPFAYFAACLLVGLGLLVGSIVQISRPAQIAHRKTGDAVIHPETYAIARITGTVDCRWQEGSRFKGQGSKEVVRGQWPAASEGNLPSPARERGAGGEGREIGKSQTLNPKSLVALGDRFALSSGLLEITYDSGAKVILQGPVTYEVDSTAGGFLSVGKLTARIEKNENCKVSATQESPATGHSPLTASSNPLFSVRTPTATVTDLGTEFGVEVKESGSVEAYVFDGVVRVSMTDGDEMRELRQGESVRVVSNETAIRDARLKPEQFVRGMPASKATRDGFDRPRDYLKAGTAGTIWSGLLNADNASRLDTLATTDHGVLAGFLTIGVRNDAMVGWEQPQRPGLSKRAPFLFVEMPQGNFEVQVEVKSLDLREFSMAGLLVRCDDDNFVCVNMFNYLPNDRRISARSEQNGIDSFRDSPIDIDRNIALRIARIGDGFLAYRSLDGGETWTCQTWNNNAEVLQRPDMAGNVQVGLWYGTFNLGGGSAVFDNFRM